MKKHNSVYITFVTVLVMMTFTFIMLKGGFFIQNDDMVMRNIVSGVYTEGPDAHAIFIMYPLSFLLKSLYSVLPSVPWYGFFMVSFTHLSILTILISIGKLFDRLLEKCIAGILGYAVFLFIGFNFYVSNEFTVTSGLLACAAIFLVAISKEFKLSREIFAGFLLLFSMWYRFEMFEMMVPFLFVAFALRMYRAYENKEFKAWFFKVVMELLAIAVLAGGSRLINFRAYSSSEWKAFYTMNDARAAIFDFDALQPYEDYLAITSENPISYENYAALQSFKYGMVEDITLEDVLKVADANNAAKNQWKQYYRASSKLVLDTVHALIESFATFGGLLTLIIFLTAFALGIALKRKEIIFTSLFAYGGMVILAGWLAYRERLIDRVLVPVYFVTILLIVASMSGIYKKVEKVSLELVVCGLVVCAFLGAFGLYKKRDAVNYYNSLIYFNEQWRCSSIGMANYPDNIYLVDLDVMPQNTLALDERGACSENQIYITSWLWKSPIWEQHKQKLGIGNIKEAFLEKENVYLASFSNWPPQWLSEVFPDVIFTWDVLPMPSYVYLFKICD